MSAWLVYLWTRLDSINILFVTCLAISLFSTICCFFIGYGDGDDDVKLIFKKIVIIPIIFTVLSVITPSKKDVAIIYVAPKLVNSKIITEDCPELAKLGIEALKQQLLEFTKGVKDDTRSK